MHRAEKPRKGCFEVRVDGQAVLSLLDMPRPFKVTAARMACAAQSRSTSQALCVSLSVFHLSVCVHVHQPLKALDMDEVGADVVKAIEDKTSA